MAPLSTNIFADLLGTLNVPIVRRVRIAGLFKMKNVHDSDKTRSNQFHIIYQPKTAAKKLQTNI